MTRDEYISEILRMEYRMTKDVIDGYKPHSEDKYKADRKLISIYRNRLGLK